MKQVLSHPQGLVLVVCPVPRSWSLPRASQCGGGGPLFAPCVPKRLVVGHTLGPATGWCVSAAGGAQLEVKLVLLWKHNMRIEYVAAAAWPLEPEGPRGTRVEVTMEGGYDILHDVSCALRQPIRSLYRTHVIRRFWNTLQR